MKGPGDQDANMDCILNVYKEAGWTSFDVTKKLRSVLGERKIGHTGTLDPMAEGVLVVCAGRATRLAESIADGEKTYEAELVLGIRTDTQDLSGKVLQECPPEVGEDAFREAVHSMIGSYMQVPPMFSAKRQAGKRLYQLAREGKTVERQPVSVQIHDIRIDWMELPKAHITVRCGKGTYIRTLISDIGEKLGCGAVMSTLKRTRVGRFTAAESRTIGQIMELAESGRLRDALLPPIYVRNPSVVCFGKFDGGHRGHQLIFENVFRIAREEGLETALLTFSKNPEEVIFGEERQGISTAAEHIGRLRNFGFDHVFEFPMTRETMRIPAEDFLKKVLVEAMNASYIVAGTDCSFGYMAKGNAEMLMEQSDRLGYKACIIKKKEDVDEDGRVRDISSTYIREEIARGNVAKAYKLLGRYFCISGTVVHGRHLGGTVLGCPTANILPSEGKLMPKPGVYLTRVLIRKKLYAGMTNVGDNPTVTEDGSISIETHILSFSEDIYGERIRVDFVERLREQCRFSSLEELKGQLAKDVKSTEAYFRTHLIISP